MLPVMASHELPGGRENAELTYHANDEAMGAVRPSGRTCLLPLARATTADATHSYATHALSLHSYSNTSKTSSQG
jgi:hypothetical protein